MPLHVAITRRVRPACEAEFQQALREFFRVSFAHDGVLGPTMIVPPPGSDSREFGILRTFADEKEREAFCASPIFNAAVVALLAWIVMPLVTRLLHRWLQPQSQRKDNNP